MKQYLLTLIFLSLFINKVNAQIHVAGFVTSSNKPVQLATIKVLPLGKMFKTDSLGRYLIALPGPGSYQVQVSAIGYISADKKIMVADSLHVQLDFDLHEQQQHVGEVVVSGTLREVSRLESPVPVEVYTTAFFKKNPTPSVYDALQQVNGVRPQLNCNICNTGDIHINGLEGPYTMVLVDGMPIVSGLSTVYGLSGIPNSLIERVEVVKGPASSLYGSEAVGGLVNIITKKPALAPVFAADAFITSWNEVNTDIGFKVNAGKKGTLLTGINYFNFNTIVDKNADNFTDVTLQKRVSVFQKFTLVRPENRQFNLAARYNYEDRWGGETWWTKTYRGGNEIYGESIYTSRWELIGQYQLPFREKLDLSFSFSAHNQNSVYGDVTYLADQRIAFSQLTWTRQLKHNIFLFGAALRYTYYDDNTPATAAADISQPGNRPDNIYLPGFFVQDEITMSDHHTLLLGMRYDYNSRHGNILTPRLAYKWKFNEDHILRINAGTGFRVVNLFTEDHAALTGAREVVVNEQLRPEKSININANFVKKIQLKGGLITTELAAFYTHFNNRIQGDFDSDPNKIIYSNLAGYAVSRGTSLNIDAMLAHFSASVGATFLDVWSKTNQKVRPVLTERWMGTWAISRNFRKLDLSIDYTGNIYGPMRLPLLGPLDPRSAFSPVWSIQNIQFTYHGFKKLECYAGIKNMLNFLPGRKDPFLIARSNDPFDKNVQYDPANQVLATPDNPYALTFDPNFVYAPNQGIRGFFGLRFAY